MTFLKFAACFLAFLFLWTLIETARGDRSLPLGKRAWQAWLKVGHRIGTFNSRLILTIFYFLIITVYAIGMKILGDPLHLKTSNRWRNRSTTDLKLEDVERQF